jgi:hypothetical protein
VVASVTAAVVAVVVMAAAAVADVIDRRSTLTISGG